MKRPNIVYIHSHDLGRFCEPMGHAIPSPNLLTLAKEGVLFRQCHCSAPTCAPSRAALLTGQHPHTCGMLGLPTLKLGYRIHDYATHLAAFLGRLGYETALAGAQHEARAPWAPLKECLPYQQFLNHPDDGPSEYVAAETIPAAKAFLTQDHDRPFFLSVGLADPHRDNQGYRSTFHPSDPSDEPEDIEELARYCQPWPHMPDNKITRREMANFKIGVEYLDRDIGRLMEILNQPEFRENTLVVFTTDHGVGVCEMKATLKDLGTGVFMVFRGPTDPAFGDACLFKGGQVIDALTQHLDFYPTLAELLGEQPDHALQGSSLMPLVRGEQEEIHQQIFTEQTYHADEHARPLRAVRTQRYKYIRSYKSDQPRGVDRDITQAFWEEYGYADMPMPDEQLFDLIFDPNEANNLVKSADHQEVLREMRTRLRTWQEETADPLVNGEIPVPPAQLSTV
jgi:arylsulfatase A-like enzyme